MSDGPTYEDRTPDDLYIKVYPKRLRQLIRDNQLTRAEAMELVTLGLRIDAHNQCYPGNHQSAEDVGMKSKHWVSRLRNRLAKKGVISYQPDPDGGSHTFTIPDAFIFGRDSYRDHNSTTGGDRTHQRGDSTTHQKGVIQQSNQKSEPSEEKPRKENQRSKQTTAVSPERDGWLPTPTTDQRGLIRTLAEAGVSNLEAYLIGTQYRAETIQKAITDSNNPNVLRRGAWIRRAIELIANQPIEYPAVPQKRLRAAAAMAVAAIKTTSPYLDDEYFSRYNLEDEDTYSADDGDDNPDRDYSYRQGYNRNGDPTDDHLPF